MHVGTAYEQIGHIAHVNIDEFSPLIPYRFLIGAILCYKSPRITLVVRKVGTITSQFRTFDMEVLASGEHEPHFMCEVRESECRFRFDYRKVYWNSRLGHEHERLIDKIARSDLIAVVYDVMAGVGPFAVPLAAKRGMTVHANDLNPESYQALVANAKLN